MRTKAALPLAFALALSACGQGQNAAAPAAPSAPPTPGAPVGATPQPGPHRAPGLWEMRVSMEGLDAVERTQICLDKASDQKIALWGAQSNGACGRSQVQRQLDGSWRFDAACNMGTGGWVMTKGVVSGDLANHYIVQSETTRTGAEVPQMNRTTRVTVEAKRIGACPAGWTGGDMSVGGMRANALRIAH